MRRTWPTFVVVIGLLNAPTARAQRLSTDPFTIVAREVPGWFYADGKMDSSRAQFELVFSIRDSSVVRVSVRDVITGQVTADDTEYRFITDLFSFDIKALKFRRLTDDERGSAPVIRAIGRPGDDAIEILFIGPDWLQSVKTVKDYMVIQRYHRSQ